MYVIDNVKELTYKKSIRRVYIVQEVALIKGVYYVKSDDNFYSVDKSVLNVLRLTDDTKICKKAIEELQEMQYITNDLIIKRIDNFNIVKKKDIDLTLEDIESKNEKVDISQFDDMTFKDMYKYIISAEDKYMYLYEIASKKFDEEYNTKDKQRKFFTKISLKAHSDFADMYRNKDCTLHSVQEEIWRKKSKDIWIDEDRISKAMYNVDKDYSNVYINALYTSKLITEREYEIVSEMNRILYILSSVNILNLENILEVYDSIIEVSKMTKNSIDKILRLSANEIKEYIERYEELQQELIEIGNEKE